MISEKIVVSNGKGIVERPAAKLTEVANRFVCSVIIEYSEKKLNCKSFLSVLSLAIPNGAEVVFTCDGEDEKAAIDAIRKVLTTEA